MRLRRCAGAPEPSLFAYAIRTIIPCAGSNNADVSWQCKLKEQIMHSFYDNTAHAIITKRTECTRFMKMQHK